MSDQYQDFLAAKIPHSTSCGFEVDESEINPILKPHQRDIVRWAVKLGRAAIFEAFGLGKTLQQLEIARLILLKVSAARKQEELWPFCRFLIVLPLGVRSVFNEGAEMLGLTVKFVRRIEECEATGIYLTNYETIRDGKMDPKQFTGVSLDEAARLRGFGGSKTFREFMRHFEGTAHYRFVATATPSPNEYIELLALEAQMRLPVTFMLLQPQSWHPDVWTDITRMLTLNGAQYAAGREMHLCPIQFDLADRVIRQFSMPGETIFDPFAGIGSVPYRAVLMGRKGYGIELSRNYWLDSLVYCKDAEAKVNAPTLFDLLAESEVPDPGELAVCAGGAQ